MQRALSWPAQGYIKKYKEILKRSVGELKGKKS